ncbi:MAG: hypothetical protein CM1200mP10_08400 [Candidatus Neomarinimicrobiota bacterium]|nr:MAG: hypothetical protein CM1200mP10_08400 [Candidatus Neomarinimicrobiota bacterium]
MPNTLYIITIRKVAGLSCQLIIYKTEWSWPATYSALMPSQIFQDTDPPFVRKVYPAKGGNFHYKDVRTISVIVDDYLSGISSDEQTMSMKLDGEPVRYAYQPLKKELYYYLPTPLNAGEHTMEYSLSDQAGNQVSGSTTFRVN